MAALFVAASIPAFVIGIVAGRRWLAGWVGTATLLVVGVLVAAWSAVLVAAGGGEGLAELAIVGGAVSVVSALAGAAVTVARG